MDLEAASRRELTALIKALQKENQELKKRIPQLERKLLPDLPFHPKPSIRSKQGKHRKKRSKDYARKSETPAHIIKHAYATCPDCKTPLYQS